MTRYIAFLRGINLGNRRIKMDRLARLIEELGYANVATYIASGNVVFDTNADEEDVVAAIEAHLRERLGYAVDTFVRSMDKLQEIAHRSVFADRDVSGRRLHVIFFREAPGVDVSRALRELETADDGFEVRDREVCWLRNGKLTDSPISTADLARAFGGATSTMRTMNTIVRIIDKFGSSIVGGS